MRSTQDPTVRGVLGAAAGGVRRVPVTTGYVTALAVVETALAVAGPAARERVAEQVSTNLDHLRAGRVDTLLTSAFVTDHGRAPVWLPGLAALLAATEAPLGSRRLLTGLAVGHVGASAAVAGGLAVGVAAGLVPTAVGSATDVGVSYAAAGAMGVVTSALPRPARWPWAAAWLAVAGEGLRQEADFTAVGHLLALGLGLAVAATGPRSAAPAPVVATRVGVLGSVLLGVGAVFGAGQLGWASPRWWAVPAVAAAGGVLGSRLERRGRRGRGGRTGAA
ncbi:hypothetical protein GCM10027047_33110 [Rhodococcus aerolatus]